MEGAQTLPVMISLPLSCLSKIHCILVIFVKRDFDAKKFSAQRLSQESNKLLIIKSHACYIYANKLMIPFQRAVVLLQNFILKILTF